jgi:hypothetical protein
MRRSASIRTLGVLLMMFFGVGVSACFQEEAAEPAADGSSSDAVTSDAGESDAAPDAGPDEVDVAETDGVDGEVDAGGDVSEADVEDVEPDIEGPPCADDGDCSDEEFCVSGACVATVCTPRTPWCEGSTVLQCDPDGTTTVVRDCRDTEQRCVEFDAIAGCTAPSGCDAIQIVCETYAGEEVGSGMFGTLETLPCRVRNDYDPDHSRSQYVWEMASSPNGSLPNLTSPSGPETSLTVDTEGTYYIQVTATDVPSGRICEAGYQAQANAPYGILVSITWETPGDEDETDEGLASGTDLDLHYLNPAYGCWQDDFADCTWKNKHPDWGWNGRPQDDPAIDIDDTNGGGPEIALHDEPADGVYRVGVHNYDAHEFGPSTVTLRIHIAGLLAFEGQKELSHNEFWEVANIEWPTGALTLVDVVHPGIADATCDP